MILIHSILRLFVESLLFRYNNDVYRGKKMENIIELKNVDFSYDGENNVLKNISFSIPKGSYTTLIGHNGSGKSTVAKLLIGLLEAQKGEIYVHNQLLNEKNIYSIRDHTGIVFQNPDNQFIGSTVADDIAFGLENHCVPQENMQAIIEDVAARVNMSEYLNSEPTQLSGGQKQRVAIAGILAIEPDLIIFDESTSMLDPQGKKSINEQIEKLHKEKNITILSITHDMEEVAQSEYVIVLKDGQVAMSGTPREIFASQKKLAEMKLEEPFALQCSRLLQKAHIFDHDALNLDEVVERLCQLK
jgi:energy-coupling factor transport system ATP-binding protein